MISLVEENYLKALFHLSHNGKDEVSVKDLSERLNIKMPTVNSMMKKLSEKNFVFYESYKPLRLTNQGIMRAALIVRKHRLTEMFLVEKMGFGWEEVHEIAEQIEHIQSNAFFDKMDEILEFPTMDPHGSPIPDKDGNFQNMNFKKLSEAKVGEELEFTAVTYSTDEFLKFLNTKNIKLGDCFTVIAIEDFDQSMKVFINGSQEDIFSKLVTDRMLVR